jgi:hypothetical protein
MLSAKLKTALNEPPKGQIAYTSAGTFNFTVPLGVTSISAVAIGAGRGSRASLTFGGNPGISGAGGCLVYSNNISVTPGEVLTAVVVSGSGGTDNVGTPAIPASVILRRSNSTVILRAKNGDNGDTNIGNTIFLNGGKSAAYYTSNGSNTGANIGGRGTGVLGSSIPQTSSGNGNGAVHGGGAASLVGTLTNGARGAVRIIWGEDRAYPDTNVLDV